jgi:hypothetical protein
MQFSLDQFAEVLTARNSQGRPYVIIGGQAVNYWATRSLEHEPELAVWSPFTSKDIDFCGNRDDVLHLAAYLKRPVVLPHKKLMTAFAGGVVWEIAETRSRVEFVRHIPGATTAEIEKLAIEHDFCGQRIRVVDPVSLLACKINLALTVDQTNRRDRDHVSILLLCVRAFLRDTLHAAEAGDLPARGWLGAVERLLKIAESRIGKKAGVKLKVDWPRALPVAEIAASRHRLISQFREKRWAQWLEKVQPLVPPKRK